ncbi:putative ketoreductase [Acephala macrosclerotiorum]|nr:putative ketoreductase [Acephala macrosclerotiorum]
MASKSLPTAKLNTGAEIPMLAYGTGTALFKTSNYDQLDRTTVEYIKTALSLGYYHLDGAELYNTEPEIGVAIKESGIPREKLFITTKVINNISNISAGLDASLKKLGVDHVDLYLIHSPFFTDPVSKSALLSAWKDMEAVQNSGKAKAIGVSNHLRQHLEYILEIATIKPVINQLEYNPYLQREGIVEWAKERGIVTAAYGPLSPVTKARPGPLDPVLERLAKKYGTMQMGVVAVTTSGKRERLAGYLEAASFELSQGEVDEITKVGKTKHFRGNNWKHDYGDSRE